jgi:hypothetical protein
MLRASAQINGEQVDMKGVGHVTVNSGVSGGAALGALVEAAVLRDPEEMDIARTRVVAELGTEATVRALAVAGNFEMMNRLLDAIGVGPTASSLEVGDAIGVPPPARFR